MGNKPLVPGNKYFLQINSRVVRAVVKEIEYKLDVNTLLKESAPTQAGLNDIIKAKIKTLHLCLLIRIIHYGRMAEQFLIDETSNVTVGACMIQ